MSEGDNFDQSHLDRRYFVDAHKYNCPYCKRRHVSYSVVGKSAFNWSNNRVVYIYRVQCGSCQKTSMHLSDWDIELVQNRFWSIDVPKDRGSNALEEMYIQETVEKGGLNLDDLFFYKQPTSFFTLDNRINKNIRELIAESQGCKDVGYLVGASGALRKAIYELLKYEKAEGKFYEDKINFLKIKYPFVSQALFGALSSIQNMTSENLHEKEGSWEAFTSKEFEYFIEVFKKLLDAIYVKPDEDRKDMDKINDLRGKLKIKPQEAKSDSSEENS